MEAEIEKVKCVKKEDVVTTCSMDQICELEDDRWEDGMKERRIHEVVDCSMLKYG